MNPVRYFHFYDNCDDHDDRLSDECKSSTYDVAGTIVSGRGVVPESISVFFHHYAVPPSLPVFTLSSSSSFSSSIDPVATSRKVRHALMHDILPIDAQQVLPIYESKVENSPPQVLDISVVVSVSGGSDSIALFHIMCQQFVVACQNNENHHDDETTLTGFRNTISRNAFEVSLLFYIHDI